jgi:hypothetical protein
MLSVDYGSFGEVLTFLVILHHCSLSNMNYWCFLQNQYGQEMVRHNVDCIDWRKAPIDVMDVYASGGGKSHGR